MVCPPELPPSNRSSGAAGDCCLKRSSPTWSRYLKQQFGSNQSRWGRVTDEERWVDWGDGWVGKTREEGRVRETVRDLATIFFPSNPTVTTHTIVPLFRLSSLIPPQKETKRRPPFPNDCQKLQQLNDARFFFVQRYRYQKWKEHLAQLQTYKDHHRHLRLPVTHPSIGDFVVCQRMEHARYIEGNNDMYRDNKQAKELMDLGFVFRAGKMKRTAERRNVPQMTWQGRFEELLRFNEANEYTSVPQSNMGLGERVHKQRKNYKKLKAGKASPQSMERVLKFNDVGFVFNTSGYWRG